MRHGFSLLETSIALALAGLVVGFYLHYRSAVDSNECHASTMAQLQTANAALQRFASKNDRYPRPADRRLNASDAQYGREATLAEIDADALDATSTTLYGALPFLTLGLSSDFSADCWNNKLSYVVTTAYTQVGSPVGTGDLRDTVISGSVTIKSNATNTLLSDGAYAIISHGNDGLGAVKSSYHGTNKGWCSVPASNPGIKYHNCDPTARLIIAASLNDGTNNEDYFDDVVIYYGRPIALPVNGGWSNWGPCVNGTKIRTCTTPSPKNGGMQCVGPFTSIQGCN